MKLEDLHTEAEKRHRYSIMCHLGNVGETQLGYRADIAAIRDRAAAGKLRCSDASYGILCEISRQSTDAVFLPMAPGKLYLTRCALGLAMEAATALERAAKWKPRKPK